jgi:hypothetical protein
MVGSVGVLVRAYTDGRISSRTSPSSGYVRTPQEKTYTRK